MRQGLRISKKIMKYFKYALLSLLTMLAGTIEGNSQQRFTVNTDATPISQGFVLNRSEAVVEPSRLRIRRGDSAVMPGHVRVLSRWGGLANDTTKPIKWLLADFTAQGTGLYTLDNSGAVAPSFKALAIATQPNAIMVNTTAAQWTWARAGTQFVQGGPVVGAELTAQLPARARLMSNGTAGAIGAAVGANQIRVNLPGLFAVGQRIRFEWKARFSGYGEGWIKSLNYDGNQGYEGRQEAYARRFVIDRGGRNIVLNNYQYLFDGGVKYFARAEPRGVDGVPDDLAIGATIEDENALLEPEKIITAINGDVLTLSEPLRHAQAVNCEVLPLSGNAPLATFQVESLTIHEQNPLRAVLKQSGTLRLGGVNPYPDLKINLWWYVYAGQPYTRLRIHLENSTNNINATVAEAIWDELKIGFALARSATASDDLVLTNAGPNSASARVLARQTVSTATAGTFKVSIPEFPEMFPARLSVSGSRIEYAPFPRQAGTQAFPRDRARVWEVFLGERADVAAAQFTQPAVTLDAEYLARSKAIRHTMLPKLKWTPRHFGGDAELAEAAARFERMAGCPYDIEQCDAQESLGSTPRMSMLEWKTSDHTQQGTNQRGRHYGWDALGESVDQGDGWTNNRYNEEWVYLYEWLRSGDPRAFALGWQHARFMATFGMVQSAKSRNGNTVANLQGLSWYEGGSSPIAQRDLPNWTHSWDEGVWLAWALTGDPILEQGALKRREAARRANYHGVGHQPDTIGTGLDWNSARGEGWAALNEIAAYNYFGDPYDLARAGQYLDNLRLSEEAFGKTGVYVTVYEGRDYTKPDSTRTQPFIWAGYPSTALREYIMTRRFEGKPDAAMEAFAIRVAKWVAYGSAKLSAPGPNRPLRGGVMSNGLYLPYGSIYGWIPNGETRDDEIATARGNLLVNSLSLGAWLSNDAALKKRAGQVFRDVCFYRDFPDGPLDPNARSPINSRNTMYNGSARKLDNQTYMALMAYPYDVAGELIQPSAPKITAAYMRRSEPNIRNLIVLGSGFDKKSRLLANGQELCGTLAYADTLTAPLPAEVGGALTLTVETNGVRSAEYRLTVASALSSRKMRERFSLPLPSK
jgi:hypothetical protein